MTLLPVFLLLILVAGFIQLRRQGQSPKPPALEYWVYLAENQLPSQEQIMDVLFKRGAIGPREGLLFSDIRLHMGIGLRQKNAHLFMTDLLEQAAPLSKEMLLAIADAKAVVTVRYVCDPPAKDDRHFRLLPHLAVAIAELGRGSAIYDLHQRRVFSLPEMETLLAGRQDPARADLHVQVVWEEGEEPHGVTYGLKKKGMKELITAPMEQDERNLVTHLLNETAREFWDQGSTPSTLEVEHFGDHFVVVPETKRPRRTDYGPEFQKVVLLRKVEA